MNKYKKQTNKMNLEQYTALKSGIEELFGVFEDLNLYRYLLNKRLFRLFCSDKIPLIIHYSGFGVLKSVRGLK